MNIIIEFLHRALTWTLHTLFDSHNTDIKQVRYIKPNLQVKKQRLRDWTIMLSPTAIVKQAQEAYIVRLPLGPRT